MIRRLPGHTVRVNTGTPAPNGWTAETIPVPLVAILDEQAGQEHSATGSVRRCVADMLNEYDRMQDARLLAYAEEIWPATVVEFPAGTTDETVAKFKRAWTGGPLKIRRAGEDDDD